jgi:hypothetical protein
VYLGLTALGVGLRPRDSTGPLAVAAFVTFRLTSDQTVGWPDAVATAVLAVAFAASTRSAVSVRAHVAAGLAVVAASFALVPLGLDATTATLTAAFCGIALTGVSLVDRRFVAALTAGLLASGIATFVSLGAAPAITSLACTLLGVQLGIAATTWRRPVEGLGGWIVAVAGIISLWWTTGTNAWAIDAIAPYDATGADLALAAAVGALLALGFVGRKTGTTARPISSWLAYGPGLAMAATWLLSSQLDPGADWATMAALVVGLSSILVGATRRLGAPLVIGTATVAGTIAISAGPRLATAPTWTWIAGGGVALLAVAALVERSDRPVLPAGRHTDGPRSIVEEFCDVFG